MILVAILFFSLELYIRLFTDYCEPWFDKRTKIVKRKSGSEGNYKTQFTNTGYFRINNEGWNSHRDYFPRKSFKGTVKPEKKSKTRIAIIGHSNVEGLRVPVGRTLSKVLEDGLIENGIDAEVYTFGFGGMHIAQALHVSRYVTEKYQPDILIIGASFTGFLYDRTIGDNFLSLDIQEDGMIREVPPLKYIEKSKSPLTILYCSKVIKFADIRFKLGENLNFLFRSDSYRRDHISKKKNPLMIKGSDYERKILSGIYYLMERFKEDELKLGTGTRTYFIDFPINIPTFNNYRDQYPLSLMNFHKEVNYIISTYDFPIINLEKALLMDYRINRQKTDFPGDMHYNAHGHKVIGEYLVKSFIDILKQ